MLVWAIIVIVTASVMEANNVEKESAKQLVHGQVIYKDFVFHPDLMKNYLFKQTGKMSRAMQEAIQNSKDAKATKIVVTIGKLLITVVDDGKGMTLDELDEYFAQIGHSAKIGDDDAIGEFAIGKFQYFCKGECIFETHDMKITVNISKSFNFAVEMSNRYVDGCILTINLFKEMSSMDVDRCVNDLKSRFKFTDAELVINGASVPAPDFADAIRVRNTIAVPTTHRTSRLFVKGIYTKDMYGDFLEHVEIFTNRLKLNTAREDIVYDEPKDREWYEEFQQDIIQINKKLLDRVNRNSNLPDDKLDVLYVLFKNNVLDIDDIDNLKFISQVNSESKLSPNKITKNYKGEVYDVGHCYSLGDEMNDIIKEIKNRTGCAFVDVNSEVRELITECKVKIIDFNNDEKLKHMADEIKQQLIRKRQVIMIDDEPEVTRRLIHFIKHANEKIARAVGLDERRIEPIRVGDTSTVPERSVIRYNIEEINNKLPKHEKVTRIVIKLVKLYSELASESDKDLKYRRFYEYMNESKMIDVIAELMHGKIE
jgi:hypothetical protein